ncbi:fungal-specific transcription factor domain-containing protein [Thelonectria olida]|uniref:Fungal-specific transcription factor domain-containing protein n=1 Tax=Thelonectria olida TaxID=1576542 RepID=A0A9P9ANB6_9HYPO|nr:fungal-specific transcription factor domain-containing protein [Thelonectria olida]
MESWEHRDPTYIHYEYEDPSRKRLRVSKACNRCRYRKTRCDGRRPFCVPCERRGFSENCTYPPHQKELGQSQSQSHSHSQSQSASASGDGQGQARSRTESTEERTDQDNPNDDEDSSALQPWSSTHGDGLGTFAGRDEGSVYGPSSTVSFFQQVLVDDMRESPSEAANQQSAAQVPTRNIAKESTAIIVPRRPLEPSANNYVDCYWEFVHPVFPVLHKTSFLQEYDNQKGSEQSSDSLNKRRKRSRSAPINPIFFSTMNLVFALGCKFSQQVPDEQKVSVAESFYKTSQASSYYDLMDSTSQDVVQMLVLAGVYLQSTRHASRCWNIVGLAIRIAQSLGLHVERSNSPARSQLDREMRRRIWHTCVNLDRLLAMTFGRPTMIHKANAVPIPTMIDDEFLLEKAEGTQPPNTPCRFGLFVSSCALLELLEEVLEFHSAHEPTASLQDQPEADDRTEELVKRVMDLNRRLDNFSSTIPTYLKVNDRENANTRYANQVRLQKHVLHCRFLLTRLLLLRPLLLSTITMQARRTSTTPLNWAGQSILDSLLIQKSCELCIQTAYQLIDAVYDSIDTPYRSSGWHCVYFTFSSAIVLLASLKCDLLRAQTSDLSFQAHWDRSLLILKSYKDRVHSAAHAIDSLTRARSIISYNINARDQARMDPNQLAPHNPPAVSDIEPLSRPEAPREPESSGKSPPNEFDPFPLDGFPELYFSTHSTDLEWLQLFQLQPNVS